MLFIWTFSASNHEAAFRPLRPEARGAAHCVLMNRSTSRFLSVRWTSIMLFFIYPSLPTNLPCGRTTRSTAC
jgi:hypothetical protein